LLKSLLKRVDSSTKIAMLSVGSELITQLRIPQMLHKSFFQDKLAILCYHGVVRSPLELYNWCFLIESSFRSQMQYLQRSFDVLPLSEAVEQLRGGRISRPTAAITFDDGFQNNYDVAFPILRELGLPATIFLTTALVDSDDTFWYLRLNRAVAKTSNAVLEWGGRRFDLAGLECKVKGEAAIRSQLRQLPRPQRLTELHKIIRELGDDPECPIQGDSPFRMLDRHAIADMAASELIDFGAHSHTHPSLGRISPQECSDEIRRSTAITHQLSGRPCALFAYPFGYRQDYNAEAIRCLQGQGVQVAVTGIPEPNDQHTPPMELRRYGIGADESIAVFKLKVHHLMPQIMRMSR
jgi:peptidoglycan/xylan/chitin deacetylase (PgdA/CDA1 family)